MKFAYIFTASVALMVLGSEALTCADVNKSIGPCISHLRNGGSPSRDCCNGVSSLNGMAKSTTDRREACECLKQTAKTYSDLKPDVARDLPGKCGVDIGVPISWEVKCNSIS